MSDTYQVAVLRDRTEMLESQLEEAKRRIYNLETEAAITEKSVMQQAARRFSNADISLTVNRVHNRKPDEPFNESASYQLQINGAIKPITIQSASLLDISQQLE